MFKLFEDILTNISVLVLIAYLLTKITLVKNFVSAENNSIKSKTVMAVIFGAVGIIATYIGIPIQGAIANARVVGVLAGGIMGGPFVGAAAGLIAGLHRYAIDIGGFTAVACAISTVVEGLIGGLLSKRIKSSRNQWLNIGLAAMAAEFIQMAIILLIARPLDEALELVKLISVPMITFNSVGLVIFIGIFDSVFIEQNKNAASRIRLVLNITDQSLPYLRKGLYSAKDLEQVIKIIMDMSDISGAAITDRTAILSYAGNKLKSLDTKNALPGIVALTISSGQVQTAENADADDILYECLRHQNVICAPLTQKDGEVIGALVLFVRKFKPSQEIECEFVSGLAKLFSTQLELSQLENQKKLLRKAELTALQSQINPHFLFNALSTITMFCREKPMRARELLLELSSYFRNTLQTNKDMISIYDEMRHVHAFVELEKARFEDKLKVVEDIPDDLTCLIPSFILQPLVENAIKHGCIKNGGGKVVIEAKKKGTDTVITVRDDGGGIPAEVVRKLLDDNMDTNSVGLNNVHKRLKSIYGERYGLCINASDQGSSVIIRIPNISKGVV